MRPGAVPRACAGARYRLGSAAVTIARSARLCGCPPARGCVPRLRVWVRAPAGVRVRARVGVRARAGPGGRGWCVRPRVHMPVRVAADSYAGSRVPNMCGPVDSGGHSGGVPMGFDIGLQIRFGVFPQTCANRGRNWPRRGSAAPRLFPASSCRPTRSGVPAGDSRPSLLVRTGFRTPVAQGFCGGGRSLRKPEFRIVHVNCDR